MKETNFIDQNKKKWKELEELLNDDRKDPDKLSNLFIQVTDDLSYARTFYPNRFVRLYLNNVAQQVFYFLYKNKSSNRSGFIRFWKEDLPDLIYSARKELLFSLCFFLLSVAIGVLSSRHDLGFASVILGEDYIKMTHENIAKGDPMAVYKKVNGTDMLLGISLNNLIVSFYTYILGVLYCIGTLTQLLYNGIMVGVFQYFFIRQGLFYESFLSIWLHGTLEISSIIIAGGAGITLGKGLVFPGTYKRSQSFFISARKSIKIFVGIVPIIVTAAIIESFMTRMTDMPDIAKLCIIIASATFIILYFVVYPIRRHRSGKSADVAESNLQPETIEPFDYKTVQPTGSLFLEVFNIFKTHGGKILKWSFLLSVLATTTALLSLGNLKNQFISRFRFNSTLTLFNYESYAILFFINTIAFTIISFYVLSVISKRTNKEFKPTIKKFLVTLFFSLLINVLLKEFSFLVLIVCILAGPIIMLWLTVTFYEQNGLLASLNKGIGYFRAASTKSYKSYLVFGLTSVILFLILQTPLYSFYISIAKWNFYVNESQLTLITAIANIFSGYFCFFFILSFFIFGNFLGYFSIYQIATAEEMKRKIMTLKIEKSS